VFDPVVANSLNKSSLVMYFDVLGFVSPCEVKNKELGVIPVV
jgi:hypothetical protein